MNVQDFSFNIRYFVAFSALLLGAAHLALPTARAELVDAIDAIVNKKAVYKSDVDKFRALFQLRLKVDPLFANNPLARKGQMTDLEIVNFLIDEQIITDKYPVADADVEQEITGIQSNLHIDREGLRAAIQREGYKFEDYFQLMRVSLAKRQLIDREIRNKAAVSDDDLRAEYNREQAGSKNFHGAFKLFLVKFPKKGYKTVTLAKEEAQKTLAAVHEDKTLEEMSKKLIDEGSPIQGGDLGYLSYGEMSATLQNEVRKLGPNMISSVIDDGDNFMIVKIGDIKADVDENFDREKDSLRGRLMEGEFQHQIKLWLELQRSSNYVKINLDDKKP